MKLVTIILFLSHKTYAVKKRLGNNEKEILAKSILHQIEELQNLEDSSVLSNIFRQFTLERSSVGPGGRSKSIGGAKNNSSSSTEMVKSFIPNEVDEQILENLENPSKANCQGPDCRAGVLDFSALHGYGCWCFFGNINSALGRGPPVDAYDTVCQKLALCYRCIFVDAAAENDQNCDPFTQEFDTTFTMSGAFGISSASVQCQKNLGPDANDNCAYRTCTCAMNMITSFFNLAFDINNVYDANLKHDSGFDYNLECPQQGKAHDRQCCGVYPNRRTYDRHEARDCCHEQSIYNPLRHVCCDDGSHVGLGTQCSVVEN